MAEKIFYFSKATGNTESVLIGLSGIVKRVRISQDIPFGFAADDQQWYLSIGPNSAGRDKNSKFNYGQYHVMDAAPTGHAVTDLTLNFDTNFYVDKLDYLYFNNSSGVTKQIWVYLDIVPVSDKSRLYLGGEYHNQ